MRNSGRLTSLDTKTSIRRGKGEHHKKPSKQTSVPHGPLRSTSEPFLTSMLHKWSPFYPSHADKKEGSSFHLNNAGLKKKGQSTTFGTLKVRLSVAYLTPLLCHKGLKNAEHPTPIACRRVFPDTQDGFPIQKRHVEKRFPRNKRAKNPERLHILLLNGGETGGKCSFRISLFYRDWNQSVGTFCFTKTTHGVLY